MTDSDFSIDPADFKTAEIHVFFENSTSRTAQLTPDHVSLQEIGEQSIVLELPASACALNHNAVIDLTRHDPARPAQPLTFRSTVKITEVEKTDDPGVIRVRARLLQYDDATWRTLLEQQGSRQEAINRFLNGARG